MKFNLDDLKHACFAVSRQTMWEQRPVDVKEIQSLADTLFAISESFVENFVERGRDPNVVTWAVQYLEHYHAIPPHGTDAGWFLSALEVLLHLVMPNAPGHKDFEPLIHQIETGLVEFRADYLEEAE